MTVSLPAPMKEWIEEQIRNGDYASASDYVRDLVRKDRASRQRDLSLDDLRALVRESRESGLGDRSMDALFAEAESLVGAKSLVNE